jgi:hypothetical protein
MRGIELLMVIGMAIVQYSFEVESLSAGFHCREAG